MLLSGSLKTKAAASVIVASTDQPADSQTEREHNTQSTCLTIAPVTSLQSIVSIAASINHRVEHSYQPAARHMESLGAR